jgi:hypothetical protein
MIHCKELNRDFSSKNEMFKALKENKEQILTFKKAQVYKSCKKGAAVPISLSLTETKGIDGLEDGFIYPVISNTYFMDYHKDVHITNSMNRTAKQQQGKIHYVVNHQLEIGKIIAYPKDVEMSIKDVQWKDLGADYEGTTQALMFKTNVFDYSNEDGAKAIKTKQKVQGSIRMQYLDMDMALNSDDPDFKEEKIQYDKHIDKIVNRKEVEEDGYFYPVYELKIVDEGSMVVLGSNSITEIQYPSGSSKQDTHTGPSEQDTQRIEDAKKALQEKKQIFLN